jgi:hypothetical protein
MPIPKPRGTKTKTETETNPGPNTQTTHSPPSPRTQERARGHRVSVGPVRQVELQHGRARRVALLAECIARVCRQIAFRGFLSLGQCAE